MVTYVTGKSFVEPTRAEAEWERAVYLWLESQFGPWESFYTL